MGVGGSSRGADCLNRCRELNSYPRSPPPSMKHMEPIKRHAVLLNKYMLGDAKKREITGKREGELHYFTIRLLGLSLATILFSLSTNGNKKEFVCGESESMTASIRSANNVSPFRSNPPMKC